MKYRMHATAGYLLAIIHLRPDLARQIVQGDLAEAELHLASLPPDSLLDCGHADCTATHAPEA